MELEFSKQIFEKYTNIKCHDNLSREPSYYTRTDGRTDRQTSMTQLKVAFLNFAKAPKRYHGKEKKCICLYRR